MKKTYDLAVLALLSSMEKWHGHMAICNGHFGYMAVGDGLYFAVEAEAEGDWRDLRILAGDVNVLPATGVDSPAGVRLYGLGSGDAPILVIPFTAQRLRKFDKLVGSPVLERVPQGPKSERWLSKQDLDVQELALVLLGKASPNGVDMPTMRGGKRALTEAQEAEIARKYKARTSVRSIAFEYGVARPTIDKVLQRQGLKVRRTTKS